MSEPTGQAPSAETGAEAGAGELLAAGAVLLPDTPGAGERAVPLTARTYRHPGLDDRVVVRLVAAELGTAEDQAAGYLGLEPVGEPAVVGLGLRASLGFPEWVLVHHPEDGHHALALVAELERTARRAEAKPKAALEAYLELAGRLAAAVPHFLPTFYEQAGRMFLAAENPGYAAQMFTRARKAEVEHGLPVDEERLDAVFLEFALAGALPVKVLSGYARELAARVPADEALRRFTRLCVRRTSGGLPPSAQMATDLRRLAKAAGEDAGTVERAYVAEMLSLPATVRAAGGWWKAHRAAVVRLARERADLRAALLDMMPTGDDMTLPGLWLEILEESGATTALCSIDSTAAADGAPAPQEHGPKDGSAGWLGRFLASSRFVWLRRSRVSGLCPLVERMADRLRTELTAGGTALEVPLDLDLLDLLLARGVPVADPNPGGALGVTTWSESEDRRDLLALEAEPRFRPAFHRSLDRFGDSREDRHTLELLAASPGGRPMLVEWVRDVARRSAAAGLPGLPESLRRLGWLPGEIMALAPEEMRKAATGDLAGVLARTLRAGLFDELAWPAWEEAVAGLVARDKVDELVVADAWPHLIVSGPAQARVIGAEGTVLIHDLRIPADEGRGDVGCHYVDGELLVYWRSRQLDGDLRGYWHTAADRPQRLEGSGIRGNRMYWYQGEDRATLPLPGGGRTTGGGVLHAGDTALPAERPIVTDGTSFWVWSPHHPDRMLGTDEDTAGWYEYDPVSGRHGRMGLPGFFADGTRAIPEGGEFLAGRLLPLSTTAATPAGTPVDGLLGWRVVRLPDGRLRGEDLAGNAVTVPNGSRPSTALFLPGDDRPRAVAYSGYEVRLFDPDGTVTSVAKCDMAPGTFAAGTAILPPSSFWHCLRPRDPEGSTALRRIDEAAAAALLKAAAAGDDDLPAAIRALLPAVGHEALLTGIAAVVRYAADQQELLDKAAERLERALTGELREDVPAGPADRLLSDALNGLGGSRRSWWYSHDDEATVFEQLRAIARATAPTVRPEPGSRSESRPEPQPLPESRGALRTHFGGPELPASRLDLVALLENWAAVAYRAASGFTDSEHREMLGALLRAVDALGVIADEGRSDRWRWFRLFLDQVELATPDGERRGGTWRGLLPLDGGGLLAVVDHVHLDRGGEFTGLFHDPAGRFDVPAPYIVRSSAPVGEPRDAGRPAAFLATWAERGPAPWFPEAAEEFARLTGVTGVMARLVVAGLPRVDTRERNFLPPPVRAALGVKAVDAAVARDELRDMDEGLRRSIVAALLPADPSRLWTDGPDAAAAAQVWNATVGRRTALPEALVAEAVRAVRTGWDPVRALQAMLDPAAEPQLRRDLAWTVRGDRAQPEDGDATGFTATTLVGAVAMAAWLAHRLPAGDPIRAGLPAALGAIRERLAHPGLLLDLGRFVNLPDFRKVAGAPTETGEGFERYGAVVMATHDNMPAPALRTALLDAVGADPYLPALRGDSATLFPAELALRIAHDARFGALLADPGDPAAGARDGDGTWWPQDPSRSAPDLVAEAAARYGLGVDAACLYLMLLAMPDPTDRNTARWAGWKPARLKAARAELAGTDLVVEAKRSRAGRSLFLPGGWTDSRSPRLPLEEWKLPLYDLIAADGTDAPLSVLVPTEPAADLYRRTWARIEKGEEPSFAQLEIRRRAPRR